jgi:hypothetical protein
LRAWVNEDREFLLWRERLGALLKEWNRAKENEDALLRGPLLVEAQKWFDQRIQDLSGRELKFITGHIHPLQLVDGIALKSWITIGSVSTI